MPCKLLDQDSTRHIIESVWEGRICCCTLPNEALDVYTSGNRVMKLADRLCPLTTILPPLPRHPLSLQLFFYLLLKKYMGRHVFGSLGILVCTAFLFLQFRNVIGIPYYLIQDSYHRRYIASELTASLNKKEKNRKYSGNNKLPTFNRYDINNDAPKNSSNVFN
jgi:hypothetical protein